METQAEPVYDTPPEETGPEPQQLLEAKDFQDEYEDDVDVELWLLTSHITHYGDDVDIMSALEVDRELGIPAKGASVLEKPKPGTERLAKMALLLKDRLDQVVNIFQQLQRNHSALLSEYTKLNNVLSTLKDERLKELQQYAIDHEHFTEIQRHYNALQIDYEQTLNQLQARTKELATMRHNFECEKKQLKIAAEKTSKDLKVSL